jgi:hypothetical protein
MENKCCQTLFYHLAASSETNNPIQFPERQTNESLVLGELLNYIRQKAL